MHQIIIFFPESSRSGYCSKQSFTSGVYCNVMLLTGVTNVEMCQHYLNNQQLLNKQTFHALSSQYDNILNLGVLADIIKRSIYLAQTCIPVKIPVIFSCLYTAKD